MSTTNAAPLRVGLVGWGYASATFHAPLIDADPGLQLAVVATSAPERLRAVRTDVEICATPAELFARPDIDLIVIPTPNDSHHPLAVAALAAGKHVVVDKPFTITAAQADDLQARARAAGRVLSVFHNRRWDGDFLGLRDVLASGRLGRVVHFESHFDRFRPEVRARWREAEGPGSGLWYDLGPHLLDQALVLFGEPRHLWLERGALREGAVADDWFHAVLAYGGEAGATDFKVVLHGSALVAGRGPRFALHGTRGSWIKFGLDSQEDALKAGARPPVWPAPAAGWGADAQVGHWQLGQPDGSVQSETGQATAGDYRAYYAGVRAAIREGQAPPVTATEAARVMRWIEAGLRSAAEGRAVAAA